MRYWKKSAARFLLLSVIAGIISGCASTEKYTNIRPDFRISTKGHREVYQWMYDQEAPVEVLEYAKQCKFTMDVVNKLYGDEDNWNVDVRMPSVKELVFGD